MARARPLRDRRPVLAVAAALLVVAACSDRDDLDGDAASPDETGLGAPAPVEVAPEDDLYAFAEDFEPGEPGDVIAVQEVDTDADATVLRVLYHSQSIAGDDVAVSGIIAVPEGEPPADGRVVLSWAHATTGIADACAPSRGPDDSLLLVLGPFLQRDMVVVATDYEGLGTPGRHPYLVGQSAGRSALDIVRAARSLGERTGASSQTLLAGHSQGGHAVLFANEIAGEWAPELELLGVVAGAPPSQLAQLAAGLESPFRGYLGMVAAGWSAAHPDADPSQVLTPLGEELAEQADESCASELVERWSEHAHDELVAHDPTEVEPWDELLVENDPGHEAGAGPVLIVHGEADALIPVGTSQLLAARMCDAGSVVRRITYPRQDHGGVVVAALADVFDWIDGRLTGEAPPDDCA